MSRRPLVGITSYVEPASWAAWRDVPAALVPIGYVRHVERAGGLAVVIPPLPEDAGPDDAAAVLSRLDALVIAGGADVDSTRYGELAHPQAQPPRADRDRSELLLAEAALAPEFPLLGVCRGMQVMAVAAGGALEQHLPDRLHSTAHSPGPAQYGAHPVRTAPGSRLAGILGPEVTVASYHHQGVADPGSYHASGWADDGVLEAFEDPDAAYRIGVQWHPEVGDDPRLFERLITVARARLDAR